MKKFLIFICTIILIAAIAVSFEENESKVILDDINDTYISDESENDFENILSEEFEDTLESGDTSSNEDIEDFIPSGGKMDDNTNTDNGVTENTENNTLENELDEKPVNSSTVVEKVEESEEPKVTYNYYTTNTNEIAKEGNKGKYSYVKRNGSYKVYWIIDFDEGYVYDFTDGNGDDSCEKIKIKYGNLNDGLELSYKNSGNAWAKYIHFKYTNQPQQLIIVDNDYFEYEYSTTSLEETLKLMESKTIWQP